MRAGEQDAQLQQTQTLLDAVSGVYSHAAGAVYSEMVNASADFIAAMQREGAVIEEAIRPMWTVHNRCAGTWCTAYETMINSLPSTRVSAERKAELIRLIQQRLASARVTTEEMLEEAQVRAWPATPPRAARLDRSPRPTRRATCRR